MRAGVAAGDGKAEDEEEADIGVPHGEAGWSRERRGDGARTDSLRL